MSSFKYFKKFLVFIGYFFIFKNSLAGSYEDFFKALRLDDATTVTSLLRRGFDPNTLDEQGRHGLLLALQVPSPKSAEVLIRDEKTKVEVRSEKDESPLMLAAFRGQKGLVELLVWRDADVNKTGWTPLHYAASGGHADIAKFLLEHRAYIDAESPNGTTPLMMAAMYGTPDVVKLLIDEGADATLKNQLGMTALDFAKQGSRKDAIQILQNLPKVRQKPLPVPESSGLMQIQSTDRGLVITPVK
jgi:ankyrin repeat protein